MGLSNAMFTAVTGLSAFGNALSVVSDNVANSNTTGYKTSSALFGDMVSGYLATQSTDVESAGAGTQLLGIASDFSTGSTVQTGTWSNVMIQGNGFFQVRNASGTDSYTRDGSFRVDSTGALTNMQGDGVIGSDGNPIQIEADPTTPVYTNYSIDKAGGIYGTLPGNGGQTLIATLRVSTFPNPQGLVRDGGNLYYPGPSAGAAVDGTAGMGQNGQITSEAVEGSNVDLATQMVNMIMYQSDYSANSKSISTANNMMDAILNLIR